MKYMISPRTQKSKISEEWLPKSKQRTEYNNNNNNNNNNNK